MDSLSGIIAHHLKKRGAGEFTLPGLMKIKTVRKPATRARKGINPFTGEEPVFKAKPAHTLVIDEKNEYPLNIPLWGLKEPCQVLGRAGVERSKAQVLADSLLMLAANLRTLSSISSGSCGGKRPSTRTNATLGRRSREMSGSESGTAVTETQPWEGCATATGW